MRSINSEAFGIGLRSEHVAELASTPRRKDIDFLELAPDNWMGIGGIKEQHLGDIAEKYPLVAHSLSLSIGDCLPLNRDYIHRIRRFLDRYDIALYSDHLCFSRDEQGYLYDLLPIPRFAKTLDYLVARIDEVQDILQRPLVLENISAYHGYGGRCQSWSSGSSCWRKVSAKCYWISIMFTSIAVTTSLMHMPISVHYPAIGSVTVISPDI